jgi:hypothetical protein
LTKPGLTDKPDAIIVPPTCAALANHAVTDAVGDPEAGLQDVVRTIVDEIFHPLVSGGYYRRINTIQVMTRQAIVGHDRSFRYQGSTVGGSTTMQSRVAARANSYTAGYRA